MKNNLSQVLTCFVHNADKFNNIPVGLDILRNHRSLPTVNDVQNRCLLLNTTYSLPFK